MHILHLTLPGCLQAPPIQYGVTADTGGHIAYILDAAAAQASRDDVSKVTIVTRQFYEPRLDGIHDTDHEPVTAKLDIRRISDSAAGYLDKNELAPRIDELTDSLLDLLPTLNPRVDVIHAHFADAAQIAARVRDELSIPFVYTPHSLGIDKCRSIQQDPATIASRIFHERQAICTADAIIVSSQDEAKRQVPSYGVVTSRRLHVVAPGAPAPNETDAAPAIEWLGRWLDDPTRPMILAIARPVLRKNLEVLPTMFAMSKSLVERANLVIVAGDHGSPALGDEERGVIRRLAMARDGLAGRFALPCRHDRVVIDSLYAAARVSGGVFVNPALHEPFGLTLLEAAASGLPVVATRQGGPVDIIRRIRHGLLVDPRDPGDVAAACGKIIGDPALHAALSKTARCHVGRLTWSRYASRAMSIYRHATARRTPAFAQKHRRYAQDLHAT